MSPSSTKSPWDEETFLTLSLFAHVRICDFSQGDSWAQKVEVWPPALRLLRWQRQTWKNPVGGCHCPLLLLLLPSSSSKTGLSPNEWLFSLDADKRPCYLLKRCFGTLSFLLRTDLCDQRLRMMSPASPPLCPPQIFEPETETNGVWFCDFLILCLGTSPRVIVKRVRIHTGEGLSRLI